MRTESRADFSQAGGSREGYDETKGSIYGGTVGTIEGCNGTMGITFRGTGGPSEGCNGAVGTIFLGEGKIGGPIEECDGPVNMGITGVMCAILKTSVLSYNIFTSGQLYLTGIGSTV